MRRVLSEGRMGSAIRRWPRKAVMKEVQVDVDDTAAWVLDVSYGGVCV